MSSRLAILMSAVLLLSLTLVSRVWAQATLENPQPGSFQSGVGVISGWVCNANTIEISFNSGPHLRAATGTIREDTQGVCGDTDNGFGLLYNWNRLGDGPHQVTAYADGVEFVTVTVTVTTLGEEFLRGASGTFPLPDFPTPGATRTLRWQQAQQNFVITAGSPQGGGTSGATPHILENPQPGSFQSGVGVISGWACEANTIEISFNGGPRLTAGVGTIREDTHGVCGDTNNGFGLLYNWNRLGAGPHTVTAYADGEEFARVIVTVTTLGEEFRRGLNREVTITDFPAVGTDTVLQWQEAQQNFVISSVAPTLRLAEVTPTLRLPPGVSIPNVAVTSLYAETATVRASPQPSLLLAEDAGGTVLLALANTEGGFLGERQGEVEVSVDSTAVTLVMLVAAIPVWQLTPMEVDAIITHPQYPALQTALSTQLAAGPNFLDRIYDFPDIVRLLREIAADIKHTALPAVIAEAASPPRRIQPAAAISLNEEDPCAQGRTLRDNLARLGEELIFNTLDIFLPVDAIGTISHEEALRTEASGPYRECVSREMDQWYNENPNRVHPYMSPRPTEVLDSFAVRSNIFEAHREWQGIREPCLPLLPGITTTQIRAEVELVLGTVRRLALLFMAGGARGWPALIDELGDAVGGAAGQTAAEELTRKFQEAQECLAGGGGPDACAEQVDPECEEEDPEEEEGQAPTTNYCQFQCITTLTEFPGTDDEFTLRCQARSCQYYIPGTLLEVPGNPYPGAVVHTCTDVARWLDQSNNANDPAHNIHWDCTPLGNTTKAHCDRLRQQVNPWTCSLE